MNRHTQVHTVSLISVRVYNEVRFCAPVLETARLRGASQAFQLCSSILCFVAA